MRSLRRHLRAIIERYPFSIWAGIVFAIALSSSTVYWDVSRVDVAASSKWLTVSQLNEEYLDATQDLVLPSGREWPEQLPFNATAEDGFENAYAAGIGSQWAVWFWFDTWAEVAALSESATDVQAAVRQLSKIYETEAFSIMNPEDQGFCRRMITAAENGDRSILDQYVSAYKAVHRDGR